MSESSNANINTVEVLDTDHVCKTCNATGLAKSGLFPMNLGKPRNYCKECYNAPRRVGGKGIKASSVKTVTVASDLVANKLSTVDVQCQESPIIKNGPTWDALELRLDVLSEGLGCVEARLASNSVNASEITRLRFDMNMVRIDVTGLRVEIAGLHKEVGVLRSLMNESVLHPRVDHLAGVRGDISRLKSDILLVKCVMSNLYVAGYGRIKPRRVIADGWVVAR